MTLHDLPYFCLGMALSVPVYILLCGLSFILSFIA